MIILIIEGGVHLLSKEEFFFMILPTYGVFGDYQVAFQAKSMISLRGPPIPEGI